MTDSFLFNSLILSFWFWGSHVMEHDSSSLSCGPFINPFLFLVCSYCLFISFYEVGTSGCEHDAFRLAKKSALSLPCISTCLGIQCSVSLTACSVMRQSIVLVSSLIVTLLNFQHKFYI